MIFTYNNDVLITSQEQYNRSMTIVTKALNVSKYHPTTYAEVALHDVVFTVSAALTMIIMPFVRPHNIYEPLVEEMQSYFIQDISFYHIVWRSPYYTSTNILKILVPLTMIMYIGDYLLSRICLGNSGSLNNAIARQFNDLNYDYPCRPQWSHEFKTEKQVNDLILLKHICKSDIMIDEDNGKSNISSNGNDTIAYTKQSNVSSNGNDTIAYTKQSNTTDNADFIDKLAINNLQHQEAELRGGDMTYNNLRIKPEFSKPEYDKNTFMVNFKIGVSTQDYGGPQKNWHEISYGNRANWCVEQSKHVNNLINSIYYQYPPPAGFTSSSKLFKDHEFKQEVRNWYYDNTCVYKSAWLTVQYNLPARHPNFYKQILQDLCNAYMYVSEHNNQEHKYNSVYHEVEHKGWFFHSCDLYKLDCTTEKFYKDTQWTTCGKSEQPEYE